MEARIAHHFVLDGELKVKTKMDKEIFYKEWSLYDKDDFLLTTGIYIFNDIVGSVTQKDIEEQVGIVLNFTIFNI